MVEFNQIDSNGNITNIKSLKQSSIGNCPHCITVPEHYNDDETCKCNDPNHTEMAEWGYVWINGSWLAPYDIADQE